MNTKALIDTGAVFSLFPGDLKDDFINIKTFKHRLWGIINDEICKINVDIGVVPIRLIDDQKIKSPIINVTAAFAHTTQVPVLLGMKGFLYEFNYSFNRKAKEFKIEFS